MSSKLKELVSNETKGIYLVKEKNALNYVVSVGKPHFKRGFLKLDNVLYVGGVVSTAIKIYMGRGENERG